MSNMCSDVSIWLNNLSKQTKQTVPMYTHEFNRLSKLAPLEVVRVIRTPTGEPRIFFIDRVKTIQVLKDLYAFKTKDEATQDLKLMLES